MSRATRTTTTVARPTAGRGRPGRAAQPDQAQIAHATAFATPPASSSSKHVPAEEHPANQRRRGWMELLVIVVASGYRASSHQPTVRFRSGTGQSACSGHAETVATTLDDASRLHALSGHAASSFVRHRSVSPRIDSPHPFCSLRSQQTWISIFRNSAEPVQKSNWKSDNNRPTPTTDDIGRVKLRKPNRVINIISPRLTF